MACSVCKKPTQNKTCGKRCNSIAQTRKVRARRKAEAERAAKERSRKPAKVPKIEQAPDRILEAIKRQGFVDFRSYLGAHTVKADGKGTWTLVEMAKDLGVPISGFISYHARWVDEQQAQARRTNGSGDGTRRNG